MNHLGFRLWYYFRQGWTTYFAFIFAAINTLIVTYYLAIENIPALKTIFPTFITYFVIFAGIGIPLLVIVGYVHMKKVAAYSSEVDITVESNPYNYKLITNGWNQQVTFPMYLLLSKMIIKSSNNEKFTDEDIEEIKILQNKIQKLIDGEFIYDPLKK